MDLFYGPPAKQMCLCVCEKEREQVKRAGQGGVELITELYDLKKKKEGKLLHGSRCQYCGGLP